jgi:hypothetical protein
VAQGMVIVTAVAVDEAQRRRQAGKATELTAAAVEEVVDSEKPAVNA